MATATSGSNIYTTGKIQSSDLNDIANHFRQWFAVNYSAPATGTKIYASDFNNLRQAILNGAGSAWSISQLPGTVSVGQKITSTTWGYATANFSSTTIEYTSSSSYTIPNGCNSMTLNQLVGGGGGGGAAAATSSGENEEAEAQSGGGGSGGHIWSVTTSVTPGQVITINIGNGGSGGNGIGYDGSSGGSSAILINGNTWQSVSGGGGGAHAIAGKGEIVNGDGGTAGSPNGNAGNNQRTGGAAPYGSYGSGGKGAVVLSIAGTRTNAGSNGANGYANITFNP